MVNLHKVLFLGGMISLTSGCAVVAVGAVSAAAATGAAVGTDPRSGGTLVDDNTIQSKLSAKLNNSDNFPNCNIYVDVYSGEVLLTGQVESEGLRQYALNVVRGYPGVIKIYDYTDIRLPSSASARSKDALITTQLKTQLLATSHIPSNNIKVETTNRVVYLMGIVTQAQAESATSVASMVGDVDKVITLFHYKQ
jgi:osmotically-inducible protein OsmY